MLIKINYPHYLVILCGDKKKLCWIVESLIFLQIFITNCTTYIKTYLQLHIVKAWWSSVFLFSKVCQQRK